MHIMHLSAYSAMHREHIARAPNQLEREEASVCHESEARSLSNHLSFKYHVNEYTTLTDTRLVLDAFTTLCC